MRIMVNGAPREVAAETLAEALEALGQGGDTVATALNEEFVPAAARARTRASSATSGGHGRSSAASGPSPLMRATTRSMRSL